MFTELRKQIFYGLLIAGLLALIAYLYNRYFFTELESYYTVLDVKPPDDVKNCLDNKVIPEEMKVMRLFFKNNSNDSIKLLSIQIYGVRSYNGFNASFFDKKREKVEISLIKKQFVSNTGQLILTDLPLLPAKDELGVYVWGTFFSTFVEVKSDKGSIVSERAYIVKGVEEFFARYWKFILATMFLVIVFIVYYYRSKRYERL
jgi:hypothetical protein